MLKKNTIELKTETPIKYKGEFISTINSLIPLQPNTSFLGLDILPKWKLIKYNAKYKFYSTHPEDSKIVKRKVEAPVLVDTFITQRADSNIKQFMINQGYFYASVYDSVVLKNDKTGRVYYKINAGKNFKINNIDIEVDNSDIKNILNENQSASFLKNGEVFANSKVGLERERIYKLLKNKGYYDFKTDNISCVLDTLDKSALKQLLLGQVELASLSQDTTLNTLSSSNTLDVLLKINKSKDSTYLQKYIIDKITVNIDLDDLLRDLVQKTESELDGVHFAYYKLPVNRAILVRNIFLQKGDYYSSSEVDKTINRLNQLGLFKQVNIRFEKNTERPGLLNCIINVNTTKTNEINYSLETSTARGDYIAGFLLGGYYKNYNLFHGGNQLNINTSYSLEFDQPENSSFFNNWFLKSNNFNFRSSLIFPKFIVPIKQSKFRKSNVPYTILSIGYGSIVRAQQYSMKNINGNFGYLWQETAKKSWAVNPISLTVVNVPLDKMSNEFKLKRDSSNFLRNTFSNNTILAENITYEFRNRLINTVGDYYTIKWSLEEAGTILTGLNVGYKALTSKDIEPIAHYLKGDFEYKHYKTRRKSEWVNRIMFGLGVPVANSTSLPYIKQYTAGGPYSLRGWRARSLGPGRSYDSTGTFNQATIDRTGDMKFEANTEYRFNVLKLFSGALNLKGAIFADAGNIWLFKKDVSLNSTLVGGEFNPKYLYNDIALDVGAGLRLDFSFFIIRVDVGLPIKQPHLISTNGWAFKSLQKNDLRPQLGLTYPF